MVPRFEKDLLRYASAGYQVPALTICAIAKKTKKTRVARARTSDFPIRPRPGATVTITGFRSIESMVSMKKNERKEREKREKEKAVTSRPRRPRHWKGEEKNYPHRQLWGHEISKTGIVPERKVDDLAKNEIWKGKREGRSEERRRSKDYTIKGGNIDSRFLKIAIYIKAHIFQMLYDEYYFYNWRFWRGTGFSASNLNNIYIPQLRLIMKIRVMAGCIYFLIVRGNVYPHKRKICFESYEESYKAGL